VTAASALTTSAEAGANAYSLIAGAAKTTATASRNDPLTAQVNGSAHLTAANNVTIRANHSTTQTHSKATNVGGGFVGIGLPTATTTISDSTNAKIGAQAVVMATAGSVTLQATTNDTGVDSYAPAT